MTLQSVTYLGPSTVDEATSLLREHDDAIVLAGGQSLIQMLKQRLVHAESVVDITGIDSLHEIERRGENLVVGAAVTYEQLRHHPAVTDRIKGLEEALATIGDKQIRSRGTFVGGIAHADPQGDPPVIATALDATLHVESAQGERQIPIEDFYVGLFETALDDDELVTRVEIPVSSQNTYSTYRAFAPRKGDYATATVALLLTRDDRDSVTDATVVAGSILDRPTPLADVESALVGEQLTEARAKKIAANAPQSIEVFDDEVASANYKEMLLERLIRDALLGAIEGTDE